MKLNCWEHKKCGREPGGGKVRELGMCPAAKERRLDGIHGGKNGGRTCWAVAGTFCGGEVQGTYAEKYGNCRKCDFYDLVWEQETHNFVLIKDLLARLK